MFIKVVSHLKLPWFSSGFSAFLLWSLRCGQWDFPSGQRSPKRSATPETHEHNQLAGFIEAESKTKIKKEKVCVPGFGPLGTCWTLSCVSLWCFWPICWISQRLWLLMEDSRDITSYMKQYIIAPFVRDCFRVILLRRLAASTYLLLLSFDPPSVPSAQQSNTLLICWYRRATFWGIRLWWCKAFPTHLSEGRRRRRSALCINQAVWQRSSYSAELDWLTRLLRSLSLMRR